jgi:peptidoglycan-associated lipoprotein
MILRSAVLAASLFAASASAQPYPTYPTPLPQSPYPQQPGQYPGMQGPILAIPVLEADFRSKAGSDTVRFGRDSYVLTPQARATLTAQAQWLIQRPFVQASIEGHADGRQSRDYAFALGERRAAAVRNYLIASGVAPEQLLTVSWGRERPTTAAAHDATWLQNSRVVVVLKQPQQNYYPQPQPFPQQPLPQPYGN